MAFQQALYRQIKKPPFGGFFDTVSALNSLFKALAAKLCHALARVAAKGGAKIARIGKAAALSHLRGAVIARLQQGLRVTHTQAIQILLW